MANGNDWNSFMQSRTARIFLNGFCAVICGSYAIDAIRELMAGGNALLIEQVGSAMYYALTIGRMLVCLWVAFVFGRMTYKTLMEDSNN